MSLEKTGSIRYDRTGPDAPARYIPQPLGIDAATGKLSYPSSRGQGVEVIAYPLRGKAEPHELQIGKVPAFVKSKLIQAHRQGHLREELSHHLGVLRESKLMDDGTLSLLREQGARLSGHISRDEILLDEMAMILNSCAPKAR